LHVRLLGRHRLERIEAIEQLGQSRLFGQQPCSQARIARLDRGDVLIERVEKLPLVRLPGFLCHAAMCVDVYWRLLTCAMLTALRGHAYIDPLITCPRKAVGIPPNSFCLLPSAYSISTPSCSERMARIHSICTAGRLRPIRSAIWSNGSRSKFLSMITS